MSYFCLLYKMVHWTEPLFVIVTIASKSVAHLACRWAKETSPVLMKNYGNFLSLWLVISMLQMKEKGGKQKKKAKWILFVMELLDYSEHWKNVEGTFTIGKRSLVVWIAKAWLNNKFEACTSIPYVWDTILKQCYPYSTVW